MRRSVLVVLLAPALLASECTPASPPIKLLLAEDSRPGKPAFYFSRENEMLPGLTELAVSRCRPREVRTPVWHIRRNTGDAAEGALRVTYGEVPPGYVEKQAADPLVPGQCYTAVATAGYSAGYAELGVLDDGRVVVRGGGRGEGFTHGRQVERAAVACVRDYRDAPTAADSLAVDEHVHPVADTTITCGTLRTKYPLDEAVSSERRLLGGLIALLTLIAIFLIEEGIGKVLR
jgi:hypothetical protein